MPWGPGRGGDATADAAPPGAGARPAADTAPARADTRGDQGARFPGLRLRHGHAPAAGTRAANGRRMFALRASTAMRSLGLLAGMVACSDGTIGSTSGADAGSGAVGSGAASGTPGAGGSGGTGTSGGGGEGAGEPVIPAEHPRIYLNDAQRARLGSALEQGTPAAAQFRSFVDAKLDGGNPYDFRGWHAALLYAL